MVNELYHPFKGGISRIKNIDWAPDGIRLLIFLFSERFLKEKFALKGGEII